MKTVYQTFATLVGFLLLQCYVGEAIRCYNCSHLQPDCEAVEGEKYLIDCNEEPDGAIFKFCRKIDMWVDFKVNDQQPFKRILRQCAKEEEPGKACYYKAGLGGRVNVCHCQSDACNEGGALSVMHIALAIPLLAALYMSL